MSELTSKPTSVGRCPQCGAPLGDLDRFCPVCGAARPAAATKRASSRRGLWLAIGSAIVLLAIIGVVALIYFSAPERRRDQPVSRLSSGPPSALAIRGAASPLVYAGTATGLQSSDDRGSTWHDGGLPGPIHAVATSDTNPAVAYLAGDSLWRDEGNGPAVVTTDLAPRGIRALAVDPADIHRVFAIGPGRMFLTSADGGQHWALLGEETPADATSLAVGNSRTRFYVGTSGHGVFASGDGRAWVNASGFVNGALPTRAVAAVAFDPASGDSYVGPNGDAASGALYSGTDMGVFKSIDGGLSWSALPLHQPTVALAVGPPGLRLMIAADSVGNVYRSTDGGGTWN